MWRVWRLCGTFSFEDYFPEKPSTPSTVFNVIEQSFLMGEGGGGDFTAFLGELGI
jgi:hypothetical protein